MDDHPLSDTIRFFPQTSCSNELPYLPSTVTVPGRVPEQEELIKVAFPLGPEHLVCDWSQWNMPHPFLGDRSSTVIGGMGVAGERKAASTVNPEISFMLPKSDAVQAGT